MFTFAPATVRFWIRLRLNSLGRGDARKFKDALDSTPTHATLFIQSMVQAGQHAVNQRYLEQARQLLQAISVANTSLRFHQNELAALARLAPGLKGRLLDKNAGLQATEKRKIDDLQNQIASNSKILELLALEAQSALDSWVSYYELLTSVYLRKRIGGKRGSVSLEADLPVFEGVSLPEIDLDFSRGKGE